MSVKQHPTLYATTTHKQRQKIFSLLNRHTDIRWSGGDKTHHSDMSTIHCDMILTFDGVSLAVRLTTPPYPRQHTPIQDILKAIRAIYPHVGDNKRTIRDKNIKPLGSNATNSRQSTQKVLF